MRIDLILLFFLFISFSGSGFSQNLVPNPSFEQFDTCPNTVGQIQFAHGWSSFRQSPDYFNSCAPSVSLVSSPDNACGYQEPNTGNAYAGLQTRFTSEYRELLGCQLITPFEIGVKYFVSFKVVQAYGGMLGAYCASNKIGGKFSTNSYNYSNPAPIDNFAHIFTNTIITDTLNWLTIRGSIIADSAYHYILKRFIKF